ncbi:TadE family type IV pilus minor pilin [Microbacterium sp. gxy059]|uniref:TadE family type IV pilus minor pilin n=1 Tax=Microbacterium sp. gxy059 TaxID=2957199 RepID=UPI003D996435
MSCLGGDRGSASAEAAVALPAVAAVLVIAVGALSAAGTQVRLQDAAADAARLVARDEPDRAPGAVTAQVPGADVRVSEEGELVCVTASTSFRLAVASIPLEATGCALAGGT